MLTEKQKRYNGEWYKRNRSKRRASNDEYKRRHKEWLQNYKTSRGCKTCGESHPACLDFHHRDPAQKMHLVSRMAHQGLRLERIIAEVEKCDILCANCHRKEHYRG